MPVRYHLRYQILPDHRARANARALATFCRQHHIEEVVLFVAAEEWNNGLLSKRDEDRWFTAIRQIKLILERAGIGVSLNPWMTVLHCDRGRQFPKGRQFQPMVSPLGERSRACASFADPGWRTYIHRLFQRFAKLGFRVIWIEDDFRYHNHGLLTWGGGFEDIVLRRFARKIGQPVHRATLVRNLLRSGKPHPWRARWLKTWREVQLEVAKLMSNAVETGAPGRTRLGLMSSHPATHSIEGRDWHRLFEALTIRGHVAHRPNFAHYQECTGRDKPYAMMMLDLQRDFRPAGCEVAPEIENFPFTHWSKSDAMTWVDMALALFHGSDALLLDLFPFSGNSPNSEPRIGQLLDRSRPALQWITARFRKSLQTQGVGMLWREDAAAHVRITRGENLHNLFVPPFDAGELLLPYGVPVSARRQPVNALFGSIAWALRDNEIKDLLTGGLLVDGVAADILCQRGFASLLGVNCPGLVHREQATYSVERVVARETGVPPDFDFSHNIQPSVARLHPRAGARVWSELLTPDEKRFGAAAVAFQNSAGGRVVTFAATKPADLPRSDHRQTIVRRAVQYITRGRIALPTITGGSYLLPMVLEDRRDRFLVVLNASPDPARPVVHLPSSSAAKATLLSPLEKPVSLRVQKESRTLSFDRPLPYLGFLVVQF